jgi:hypothetical protein
VTSGLNYRKGNATRPPQANKRDSGQPTLMPMSGETALLAVSVRSIGGLAVPTLRNGTESTSSPVSRQDTITHIHSALLSSANIHTIRRIAFLHIRF